MSQSLNIGMLNHIPVPFANHVITLTREMSTLYQSGVVIDDSTLSGFIGQGGWTFQIPSWEDLEGEEEMSGGTITQITDSINSGSVSGDDAITLANLLTQFSAIQPIAQAEQLALRQAMNKTWGATDLISSIAGSDPIQVVAQRLAAYWSRVYNRRVIDMLNGMRQAPMTMITGRDNDNFRVQGSNLVLDISGETGSAANFTFAAYLSALNQMLDAMDDVSAIICHSAVFNEMKRQNSVDYLVTETTGAVGADTNVAIAGGPIGAGGTPNFGRTSQLQPYYDGRQIIIENRVIDNDQPAEDGQPPADNQVFNTWLIGAGSIRSTLGSPKVPVEVERNARAASGGGLETITSRIETIIHPMGVRWAGAAGNPTRAALRTGSNYRLTLPERRHYPFVCLTHMI